ncbi:hypothetical protein PIB30_090857 [Stylosanthes scabra]|uniref:Uncharacterized protein n=1 Tax=Stylosanthes scabra TaxID=79078 RepID=A0ABU6YX67_9FABA|nr:hypothetical protein [Stylosanthes scabra]
MEISFLASGPVKAMPKARSITPAVMENIRHPPVQPFNPQQHYHHEQPADGYGWGQLQEDMANMTCWPNKLLMGFASKKWKQGNKRCGNSNKRCGKNNINSNKMREIIKNSKGSSSNPSKRNKRRCKKS